jgi:hypothetical protein
LSGPASCGTRETGYKTDLALVAVTQIWFSIGASCVQRKPIMLTTAEFAHSRN